MRPKNYGNKTKKLVYNRGVVDFLIGNGNLLVNPY